MPQPTPQVPEQSHEEYSFPVQLEWGHFDFSVLTVRQQIQTRHKAVEIYGAALPSLTQPNIEANMARALAEMEIAAQSVPAKWDWSNLYNPDRVWELWEAYQKQRDSFRESMGVF